ncbi:MAG: type II restriction endonuclease [Chitinophagaceae bacterium]
MKISEDDLADTEIYQVQEIQEEYGNSQREIKDRRVTNLAKLKSITSVIKDFDFFTAEKWKIASDRRGSGILQILVRLIALKILKNAGSRLFTF